MCDNFVCNFSCYLFTSNLSNVLFCERHRIPIYEDSFCKLCKIRICSNCRECLNHEPEGKGNACKLSSQYVDIS